ncbi:MAG: Ig-like domain-containing protein [Oscillospiraceae bacterium]|nr:Ig-like domain-containing protein [Oscillospiraceae bacterium]
MENKLICYYCGTVYDETLGKCPLCGSSLTTEDEASRPVQRRRITAEERRERQRAAKGKYSAPKKKKTKNPDPKPFRIAALVFLILAVLVVFYFIGDMIGWWPGLEDRIVREDVYNIDNVDQSCKELIVDQERLEFEAPGETAVLTASVNLNCGKTLYCISKDESVATISKEAQTEIGEEMKTVAFTVAASGYGETEIELTCGDRKISCTVSCIDPTGTVVPTEAPTPEDFTPQLNYPLDASLYAKGATLMLRVMNLPAGMRVEWTSDDVTVAKVSQNGIVTAISGGKTKVTALVGGKKAEVLIRCTFGSNPDNGAHLQLTDVTLSLWRNETYDLFLYDSDGVHISDITYTIENSSVCEVKDGVVTPKNRGTTNVIITYNGKEYTCIIRVS